MGILKKIVSEKMELTLNFWNRFFGNNRYKKFIIISSGRTGSNLLVKYLNSHKNIEAKGELFDSMDGKTSITKWNEIFNFKNKNIIIAGFKMFYYHPADKKNAKVWDLIMNDKDIKIIHLVRKNKIRSYVSLQIAEKTGVWKRKNKKEIPLNGKQIEIDFEDFIKRTETIEKYEEKTRIDYQEHPYIEISYEELINDKDDIFEKLCSFLEVDNQNLKSQLKKQNNEQLEDLILNFDEFKKLVAKSKYSDCMV